jgi:acetyl-CoA carboxylase biotin carboxyl carrier protein
MELTEDDVIEILKLFEQSKFDFLQLEHGERKITVSKGGYVSVAASAAPHAAAAHTTASARTTTAAPATAAPAAKPDLTAAADPGLIPVTAPMVGKFYAAASPSDPPYVQPGAAVEVGATVGLIEVMKVFASIKTETAGVIERILVSSGEFVEFGQPLFLLRPN